MPLDPPNLAAWPFQYYPYTAHGAILGGSTPRIFQGLTTGSKGVNNGDMRGFLLTAIGILVFASASMTIAHTVVLAADSASSRIDLTINQGPGLLLPTSPFYFADIAKNNLRLFLSSYENGQKAKIHLDIAGERIAEVKVMLEENNMPPRALDRALASMAENIEGAKNSLKAAKNSGKNVERLASDLNVIINNEKDSLRILQAKTDTEGSLKIKAKLAKVREIEVGIEDEMAGDLRQNETKHELAQAIADEQKDASDGAKKVATLQEELSKLIPAEGVRSTVAGAATQHASSSGANEKNK